MSAPSLTALAPGLADPVHDAQQVFRQLLEAMSRPGRIQSVGIRLAPPPGIGLATAAVLLAVADPDLRVTFAPGPHAEALSAWLRFHTGARTVAADADWYVADHHAAPSVWDTLRTGTDEAPHTSATLLLDVPSLATTPGLRLAGPGIEHTHALDVGGVTPAFWQARIAQEPLYPRGIDLVLCHGHQLAALPRSTRVALED